MSKQLIARGHEVTIVCGSYHVGNTGLSGSFYKGIRSGNVDGINIIECNLKYSSNYNFYKRSKSFIIFALKSIKIALTREYDLILASSTPLTISLPGILARWLRGKPFIFEVRDLWPELPKAMKVITNPLILFLLDSLEWISYHSAHLIIALSPGMVEGIKKRGIPNSKIIMIPNGCDFKIFEKSQQIPVIEKIKKDDFVAIFSGSHGVANGLDSILKVARDLKSKNITNIKIILIGDGPTKNGLINQSIEYNLDNIVFLDPVSKHDLAKVFQRADVGLQILADIPAFYYGTSPNKFFDYLSAGLPIITNYPGWVADLIINNKCGAYVEPNSYDDFSSSLIDFRDDKILLEKMGINSFNLGKREFLRSNLTNQMVDNIERIKLNHN